MKTRVNKYGTQGERRAAAKAKLLDATVALVAEAGISGFSLASVGERAGDASRGLANHHFKTREALLEAAAAHLLPHGTASGNDEWGLPGLVAWMGDQLAAAARGDVALQAVIQLSACAGAATVADMVKQHVARRTELIRRHLERARLLEQIRSELEPDLAAPALLAQLDGELARVARGGESRPEVFMDLVTHALTPIKVTAPGRNTPKPSDAAPKLTQGSLGF